MLRKLIIFLGVLFLTNGANAQFNPPLGIQDEGGVISRPVNVLNCSGAGIECTKTGSTATITVSGSAVAMGDLTDVGTGTPTDKNILIGNGTTWESKAMSGDVTISNLGVTAIKQTAINFVTTSGNVGIGNTAPSQKLEVTGTVKATDISLDVTANYGKVQIHFEIDGGGSAITTGAKAWIRVPYNMTISSWNINADQSGSIVIDVWKDTYANFPPTVADTIAGSEKPTLSSAQSNQDISLSTWTTSVTAGDYIRINVDSASTVTKVTLDIYGTKG